MADYTSSYTGAQIDAAVATARALDGTTGTVNINATGDGASSHTFNNSFAANFVGRMFHTHASNPFGLQVEFSNASPDNNTNQFAVFSDSTTTRCIIYSDGDLQNHDNSYGAISDRKLKQDIVLAGSQWDDLKAIGAIVSKYRMISDVEADANAPYQIGVIAQDLEAISPGLVRDNPDFTTVYDEDGNAINSPVLDENGDQVYTKSVRYSVMYMKAVKALGEALEKIEELESRIAALES